MLKRIYLLMHAALGVVVVALLASFMWLSAPTSFNPIVAVVGFLALGLAALQAANAFHYEAYGRPLVSWWFPFWHQKAPFALRLLFLLFGWALVAYPTYLWVMWLLR